MFKNIFGGIGRRIIFKINKYGGATIKTKLLKLDIPLNKFEKGESLTPVQVQYLKEYVARLTPKDKEKDTEQLKAKRSRINNILATKVQLKNDPFKKIEEKKEETKVNKPKKEKNRLEELYYKGKLRVGKLSKYWDKLNIVKDMSKK